MRIRLHTLAFLAAAASQLGATDCGTIIDDAGFDHWCGDKLCFWEVERGEIGRVPTWRAGDDGVELIGDDVAISQLTPVTSRDTDCIRFEMVTDVEETAEVHLEADVFGDGTVEWSERIPTASWKRVSWLIGLDGDYQGVRFRLTKVGGGRAVLARIHAEVEDGPCPSYLEVGARPLGAACVDGGECESGVCAAASWVETVCSACDDDSDCGGDVCGVAADAPGHLARWRACVPPASRALGEPCLVAAECATGACDGRQCAECGGEVMCAGGEACQTYEDGLPVEMCGEPDGDRATGAACLLDADCASGACDGAPLGYCDGVASRPCYQDDDCPTGPDLAPGACTFVAVAGGTCR